MSTDIVKLTSENQIENIVDEVNDTGSVSFHIEEDGSVTVYVDADLLGKRGKLLGKVMFKAVAKPEDLSFEPRNEDEFSWEVEANEEDTVEDDEDAVIRNFTDLSDYFGLSPATLENFYLMFDGDPVMVLLMDKNGNEIEDPADFFEFFIETSDERDSRWLTVPFHVELLAEVLTEFGVGE
jgi:hypothetical protein